MPDAVLPEGRYLSCALRVSLDAGGQTRALLLRNRNLARAGVRPDVLVLGAAPDHERRRQELLERGLLVEGIGMLNIYDHYRAHGWGDLEPIDVELRRPLRAPRPRGRGRRRRALADHLPRAGRALRDVRLPATRRHAVPAHPGVRPRRRLARPRAGPAHRSRGPRRARVQGGRASGSGGWIRELAEGQERTFVFIDSRYVVPHVVPIRARARPRRLRDAQPARAQALPLGLRGQRSRTSACSTASSDMDAMVTLTDRQRDDIAERRGRTSNMFVVPNPVDLPPVPADPPARDPHRVAIMARLEPQKRLQDAIAAFERVVRAVPEARLDIFGDGSRREPLQEEIDRRAARRARHAARVRSRGARRAVGVERVPDDELVRGLPAVDAGEHEPRLPGRRLRHQVRPARADHRRRRRLPRPARATSTGSRIALVELLRSPELVARMSAAARARPRRAAARTRSSRDWAGVLHAGRRRGGSTARSSQDVQLETTQLRTVRGGRLRFAGMLRVQGQEPARRARDAPTCSSRRSTTPTAR